MFNINVQSRVTEESKKFKKGSSGGYSAVERGM